MTSIVTMVEKIVSSGYFTVFYNFICTSQAIYISLYQPVGYNLDWLSRHGSIHYSLC